MKWHKFLITVIVAFSVFLIVYSAYGQTDIIVQNADGISSYGFTSITNFDLAPRIVLQFANDNAEYRFVAVPTDLRALVGQVPERIILRFANSNHLYIFGYPSELVGDHTPPVISNISVSGMGYGKIRIGWLTDEYSTSNVAYGTQPGSFPYSISDPLFRKQHETFLSGLAVGKRYYFRLSGTDRSGNSGQSTEGSFTVQSLVYLPVIKRK